MLTDVLLVLVLILLNGVFAMSEIAVVSSRRARLAQMADSGSTGAQRALALAAEPTRFLSSVQVGITSIGILNGAIGESAIADPVRLLLEHVSILEPYAESLSLAVMVVGLTYVSLIVGELVPKRLALTHPERVATVIARPMQVLARIGRPLVYVLSLSTDTVLRLIGVRPVKQPAVTLEEIKLLLEQGAEEGIFEQSEHDMVSNVLNLDERRVASALTPRSDVVYLDVRDSVDGIREKLRTGAHSVLPLCDGGLDQVLGCVRATRVLEQLLEGTSLDLPALAEQASFVPETMTMMRLLEEFKRTRLPVAIVVDEFGAVEGLVSLIDVMSSIVGDLPPDPGEEPMIVERDHASWLMDGAVDLETLVRTLDDDSFLTDDDRQHCHTLGGFVMLVMGRVPRTGDTFDRGQFRFEVVDMDANRIDRVLVTRAQNSRTADAL